MANAHPRKFYPYSRLKPVLNGKATTWEWEARLSDFAPAIKSIRELTNDTHILFFSKTTAATAKIRSPPR